MAHFHTIPGNERISGKAIAVTKPYITIGLWGYLDFEKRELDVVPTSRAVTIQQKGVTGNSREWLVASSASIRTRLEARTKSGAVWDWVELTFMPATAGDQLLRAYHQGAISFSHGFESARDLFLIAAEQRTHQGKPVEHSRELVQAVSKLASVARVQAMRTFAPNNAFHGQPSGNKWVCSCIDVMEYAGCRFHYTTPKETLISGVVRLINDLPADLKYDIGFVRPIGGDNRFDDKLDVFYPVRDQAEAHAAFLGKQRPLSDMLETARTRVGAALATKRHGFLYPDGADHVHLRAYS